MFGEIKQRAAIRRGRRRMQNEIVADFFSCLSKLAINNSDERVYPKKTANDVLSNDNHLIVPRHVSRFV